RVSNGTFETGALSPWTVLGTSPTPYVDNSNPYAGTYASVVGTPGLSGAEPLGDGSIYQQVLVPANGGTLSYWYWPQSNDGITFDWQDAYVTDLNGNIL